MFKKLSVVFLVAMVAGGFALAQEKARPSMGFDYGKVGSQSATIAALLDAYQTRFHSQRGQLDRAEFDAMFADMLADLDLLLDAGQSASKSAADCATACSLAQAGEADICQADSLAESAINSCPSSVYGQDAVYYADAGCLTADWVVYYTCQGASAKTQALSWLDSAKRRAERAWTNAWYAYSNDSCAPFYQVASAASDAYVNFHNARTAMSNCN